MFKLFRQYLSKKVLFLFFTESVLISLALLVSIHLRFVGETFRVKDLLGENLFPIEALLIVGIGQLCLYYNDLYDLSTVCRRSELLIGLAQAIGGWCILLAAASVLYPPLLIGRGIILLTVSFTIIGIYVWREASARLGILFNTQERVLILGTSQVGIDLCRKLQSRPDLDFEIVGYLDEDHRRVGHHLGSQSIIGTINQLPQIAQEQKINRVIISLNDRRGKMPVHELLDLRLRGVVIEDAHTLYESLAGHISLDAINPSWLIFSSGFRKFRWQLFLKRCFDLLCASILFALTFPIMIVVAILVKLDSDGPALFKQERVGQFGKTFTLLKFRSMTKEAEKNGAQWATKNDARVTRLGRFLRDYRFDELPQVFNILVGDMSFVGPRPERPVFVKQLEEKIPYYRERHLVKPGLTGWAQVRFPYASTEEETKKKLEYDFFYLKNFSVSFDLAIAMETVKTILYGRGAR